jgi:hypothetical protein
MEPNGQRRRQEMMRETQARQAALADRAATAVRVLARACGAIGLPGLAAEAAAADAALAAALAENADGAGLPAADTTADATAAAVEEEKDLCIGSVPLKRRRTLSAPAASTPPTHSDDCVWELGGAPHGVAWPAAAAYVMVEGGEVCGEGSWGAEGEAECASLSFLGGTAPYSAEASPAMPLSAPALVPGIPEQAGRAGRIGPDAAKERPAPVDPGRPSGGACPASGDGGAACAFAAPAATAAGPRRSARRGGWPAA